MIRNVLFDWSGTLVNDLPAVLEATNYVFGQAGLPELTREQFRAEFCLPLKKFYDRHTPHIEMAQLETWFHSQFRNSQQAVVEIPHARAFLQACQDRQVRMFVLSTMHPEHFWKQAVQLGFDVFFEKTYLGVADKEARILEVLQDNRLATGETLFIGDMQHDMAAARHGGVFSCAVLTGYNSTDSLRASQPDLLVDHLGSLQELLEKNRWNLLGHTLPAGE